MLDLRRLERLRLTAKPLGQDVVGWLGLAPNYQFLPGVKIHIEGVERIPRTPVLFAMNHTDRYNCWPFQYVLWREHRRFTATWVKGKYYENGLMGAFLEWTNNIPAASRGYVVTRDFVAAVGRKPTDAEYETLRRWIDAVELRAVTGGASVAPPPAGALPDALLTTPRDMLGRAFDPVREDYAHAVDALFRAMMRRFVALNREALDLGLDLLVFPQGTRSIRLLPGHNGFAQIALKFRLPIVPLGCNGSDRVYPGPSPWGKRGRIVYRVGEPIPYDALAQFHVTEDFEPFTPEAKARHREKFDGVTTLVMDRINGLLDPEYQYAPTQDGDGARGSDRFL